MSLPTASELLRWGDLESSRRRRARGLVGAATPLVIATVLSALLALELLRRMGAFGGEGSATGSVAFALAAVATAHILVVFGTPYRMYWRSDSALLGRMPIPGGVLFRLALARTARSMAVALLPVVAAVVVVAIRLDWMPAVRLAIVGATCAVVSGLLAPAATLAAGGIVASDRAQAMIDSFGGEFRAPSVAWLGALPAFVATAIGLLTISSATWVLERGAWQGQELLACLGLTAFSVVSIALAWRSADGVLLAAQREIAALDQERLAHIDLSHAGPLERVGAALLCRSSEARLVFDKDAALMRRRFPAPYFVAFVSIGIAWILVASDQVSTAIVVVCSLAAYSLVMARRLATPPVEAPRLLRSLPISTKDVARAKRTAVVLRAVFWVGLSAASLLALTGDQVAAAIVAVAALGLSVAGGAALAVERGPR